MCEPPPKKKKRQKEKEEATEEIKAAEQSKCALFVFFCFLSLSCSCRGPAELYNTSYLHRQQKEERSACVFETHVLAGMYGNEKGEERKQKTKEMDADKLKSSRQRTTW
jgi:hypothetical protein